MDKVVIWGATGQAIVLEELLSHSEMKIEAFFENNLGIKSPFDNIPIFYKKEGLLSWLSNIKNPNNYGFLVAIGGSNGYIRESISKNLQYYGLNPMTVIHKTSFVAYNSIIGTGCQILANTSICARVRIGTNCIINTSSSIDHECRIGNAVHLAPGARLAGCVVVEDNVFIGTNATILPRIHIGLNSIIGAGAVVTKDIPPYSIAVGSPAKVIKTIEPVQFNGDIF